MEITVKFFSGLKKHLSSDALERAKNSIWRVPEKTTIGQLIALFGLPPAVIIVIAVNSTINRDMSHELKDGDTVLVQPVLCGG